jgi:hypothetical protein
MLSIEGVTKFTLLSRLSSIVDGRGCSALPTGEGQVALGCCSLFGTATSRLSRAVDRLDVRPQNEAPAVWQIFQFLCTDAEAFWEDAETEFEGRLECFWD